jgi:5-methylcytosine-specific restriction endonuclease McrA
MAYDNSDGRLRGRKLQAARLRIWSANPHCARCRKLVAYPHGFELDHITALHKDGSNDDNNMQVLCPPCHATKTTLDCDYRERAKFDAGGRVIW